MKAFNVVLVSVSQNFTSVDNVIPKWWLKKTSVKKSQTSMAPKLNKASKEAKTTKAPRKESGEIR
jgi:hypothetical protein